MAYKYTEEHVLQAWRIHVDNEDRKANEERLREWPFPGAVLKMTGKAPIGARHVLFSEVESWGNVLSPWISVFAGHIAASEQQCLVALVAAKE